MKTPEQVTVDIERRMKNTWNTHLEPAAEPSWPHTFPLGPPTKTDLEREFTRYREESLALRKWAAQNNLELTDTARLVASTTQRIPTHITVIDVDAAARLCGPVWTTRLARGRARLATLRTRGFAGDLTRVVRDVDGYSNLDFALLCSTADWFRQHGSEPPRVSCRAGYPASGRSRGSCW